MSNSSIFRSKEGSRFLLQLRHTCIWDAFNVSELSVIHDCLLWGSRVIVPSSGQRKVLEELHETHMGCTKMKALARSYVWWPAINNDIEILVSECALCQETGMVPAAAPLHPWEWSSTPWSRLHVDFAGPFMGQMFMVLVDAHSKWMEVQVMSNITAQKTIKVLRGIFSIHGLPSTLVSDNGPAFISREFDTFL